MLDLVEELKILIASLDAGSISYALCGGLAMAVHGHPRATIDIDLLILEKDVPRVERAVSALGYSIKAVPMSFRGGAVEIRRVSKVHESGQVLSLDLLLVTPATQAAWDGRLTMEWDFGNISVVSREGLIALKSLRASGTDQDDIQRLRNNDE